MITAIVLARCNSSRLKKKHFYKINNKELINIIYENLKKNDLISEIILATGTIKENKKFRNFLKKDEKIYFHKNNENVTERICEVTKKIKNEYSVLISGDCCLTDNDFIKRLYNQIKNTNFDFIKSDKKLVHEGITLFRTKIWKKVNQLSVKRYQQEHPGYIVKEFPKLFKIGKFVPKKYEFYRPIRLSVDTESDLDFMNLHARYLKKQNKKFNLKEVLKSKNFNYINTHVTQKKAVEEKKNNYVILTSQSKKEGLGHFSRSKIIFREINEVLTSNVKIYCIGKSFFDKNFTYRERLKFHEKINYSLFEEKDTIIIDLPKNQIKKLDLTKLKKNKIIFIDNYKNLKNSKIIVPSIRKPDQTKKNFFIGKNYLILPRKSFLYKDVNLNRNQNIFFNSGSIKINKDFINFIFNKNLKLIVGKLISKKEIELLKDKKIKYLINPKDLFKILSSSNEIFCKFGVSTYELISIGKTPIIYDLNEVGERLKDIKFLFKKGLVKLIRNNKVISNKREMKLSINTCLNNLIKVIQ